MTDVLERRDLRESRRKPAPLSVVGPETVSMTTRDGVRLDADVYRPATGGPYPVLLQRQAYGRRIACTICYAHPAWYAAQGFIVVVQDIRGRGTSEGRFNVGEYDVSDGAESVEWAARLEGSTGVVGMYGFSYQGYNQLMAALGDCPALKALAPAMFPWDVRTSWAWENDAFRLGGALGWAIQIAAETARHAGDAQAYAELLAASRNIPFLAQVQCRPPLIEKFRDLSHYHDWIDRKPNDPYWARISPSAHLEAIAARKLPMLMIGGWYDSQLRGTLAAYRDLAERKRRARASGRRAMAALPLGPQGRRDRLRAGRRQPHGCAACSLVQPLAEGPKTKASARSRPCACSTWAQSNGPGSTHGRMRRFPSHSPATGMVSVDPQSGPLAGREQGRRRRGSTTSSMTHGAPRRAWAARLAIRPGRSTRSVVEARGDVLTFTTAPFDAPFAIGGRCRRRPLRRERCAILRSRLRPCRASAPGGVIPLCRWLSLVARSRCCDASPYPDARDLHHAAAGRGAAAFDIGGGFPGFSGESRHRRRPDDGAFRHRARDDHRRALRRRRAIPPQPFGRAMNPTRDCEKVHRRKLICS